MLVKGGTDDNVPNKPPNNEMYLLAIQIKFIKPFSFSEQVT